MEKLLVCEVPKRNASIVINGEVTFEHGEDTTVEDKEVLINLNVENLEIETTNGQPYEITGYTWSGHEFNKYDVFDSVVKALLLNSGDAKAIYVAPIIQIYINTFRNHMVEVENVKVPKYIPSCIEGIELLELYALTSDGYAYYSSSDGLVTYNTEDMSILTDVDAFSFSALCDSLIAIKQGKEHLLYCYNKEELEEIDLEED